MKKLINFLLIGVLIYTLSMPTETYAASWPTTPSIDAKGAVIMELSSGTILYSKNMNKKYYPASITKIMMTLVALENSSLNETVTISQNAINKIQYDAANMSVVAGEKISMKDALYGAMLKSANELCNAVAEHIAGSIDAYVDMMNAKAKELGCKNTHFVTTNGLHDDNHYTTAYDYALISRAAFQNETFRKITGTEKYTIGKTNKCKYARTFSNHHQMLVGGKYSKKYNGCLGGKTGFTTPASNTLVTYATKNNVEYVVVILKAKSNSKKAGLNMQYDDTKKLIEKASKNFKKHSIVKNEGNNLKEDFVSFNKYFNLESKNNTGYISIDKTSSIILPKKVKFSSAKKKVNFNDNPDIVSGDNIIGNIRYTYGGRQVGKVDIIMKYYPKSKVTNITLPEEMLNYSLLLNDTKTSTVVEKTKSVFFQIFIIVVIVGIALILFFYLKINHARKRRRRAYRSRRKRSRITFDDKDFRL